MYYFIDDERLVYLVCFSKSLRAQKGISQILNFLKLDTHPQKSLPAGGAQIPCPDTVAWHVMGKP